MEKIARECESQHYVACKIVICPMKNMARDVQIQDFIISRSCLKVFRVQFVTPSKNDNCSKSLQRLGAKDSSIPRFCRPQVQPGILKSDYHG